MNRKRFIAGAVCPACGEMDRLLVEADEDNKEGNGTRRRCVACGYTDTLDAGTSPEPRNRLDGGLKKSDSDGGAQVVRLLDPTPSRSSPVSGSDNPD